MRTASEDTRRVFAAEFFEALSGREARWRTEVEAGSAGPCRVVRRDRVYSVIDDTEPDDGASVADFTVEQWALLLAATRGARYRYRSIRVANDPGSDGRFPVYARSLSGGGAKLVGWHSRCERRDLEAMHVAEHVLRSPRRLAHFLEAAGPTVLEGAAKILMRRLGLKGHIRPPVDTGGGSGERSEGQ